MAGVFRVDGAALSRLIEVLASSSSDSAEPAREFDEALVGFEGAARSEAMARSARHFAERFSAQGRALHGFMASLGAATARVQATIAQTDARLAAAAREASPR